MGKIKSLVMSKKAAFMAAVFGLVAAARAEGEPDPGSVSDLWDKLNVNFASLFQDVFTALKTPVGAVLAVVFVIAVFYFCVRMAKTAINKRNSI